MHIVMVGNPGVGKSAILNSLIGSPKFSSGLSYGSGKTKMLKTVEERGVKYSDTPGLGDTKMRETAATEISRAFKNGGDFKLIFVVLTVAARVRPEDLATIEIVLKAIQRVGIDTKRKYSIIVNMCGPNMLEGLKHKENRAGVEIPFGVGDKVDHIGYMPFVEGAREANNYMLSADITDRYVSFIDKSPVFRLRANSGLKVEAQGYKLTRDELQKQLEELYELLEEVKEKKNNPLFWAKLALKLYQDDKITNLADLINLVGRRAPFIMDLKLSSST